MASGFLKYVLIFLFSLFVFQVSIPCFAEYPRKRTVYVHLFEWKWKDIALECENFLGPKGFGAVQVSPPQEHAVLPNQPWYQRYQPVSYILNSRSGNREEFADMVRRCKAAGVDVYVDAVINHMTWVNRSGETKYGSNGSPYSYYRYPSTYESWDFHQCGRHGDNTIWDYQDRWEVQNCDMGTVADLKTESEYVRNRIAAYLNDLLSLGVAGFRIDAAKHMPVADLQAILSKLSRYAYFFSEVIDFGGEPIKSEEYFSIGDVTEFRYARQLAHVFNSGKLSWLQSFGTAWGFIPSDQAVVFVDTHDTQRGHGGGGEVLTYKDGQRYVLANTFMLAWPHGYPQVMSSYRFDNPDQGPPADGNGTTHRVWSDDGQNHCFGEWVCEHRWAPITRMVDFHNYTDSAFYVSKWWSDGDNRIAFARGNLGYAAFNNTGERFGRWFDTGLPAGKYCDIMTGESTSFGCSGVEVVVNEYGWTYFEVPANSAVVIYGGSRI